MRSPEQLYEDLEGDHRSRESEVRLFERLLSDAKAESEREMLKRSLILLIYAHLEGFAKFSLLAYTSALNSLKLPCSEASYPVVAASLSNVFASLRDPNSKHKEFRRSIPDDAQLHLAAREQVFIESYEKIVGQRIDIPDKIVDTKSNLSSVVLKKMLFQLGLSYPAVSSHEDNINKLLGIRNAIAHGDRLKVPSDKAVSEYSKTAFEVMKFLQNEVYNAFRNRLYLRAEALPPNLEQPAEE